MIGRRLLRGVDARLVAFAPGAGDHQPGLLGQDADEATYGVLLPARRGHERRQRRAALLLEERDDLGALAALAGGPSGGVGLGGTLLGLVLLGGALRLGQRGRGGRLSGL